MDISSQAISALRDEQVFVLSGSQLQAIITKALLEAQGSTFSGQDELSSMKTEIDGLKSQIKELDSYVSALAINQKGQSQKITKILARKDPGKKAQERAEKINHYMENRPDHKASFESLRGFLQVNDVLLNAAIDILMKSYPGKFMKTKDGHDKRKRFLAEIVKF